MTTMKTSTRGISMIKQFEGFRAIAYKAVSSEKYYTIGYGHYGADVSKDMKVTETEAEELLKKDLATAEKAVNNLNRSWTQNQFDALVSFTYNCGAGNLAKLTTNRLPETIASKMLEYNKSGGKVMNGLVKRRKAESELFCS